MPYKEKRFCGALANREPTGIGVFNSRGTVLKKINAAFIIQS